MLPYLAFLFLTIEVTQAYVLSTRGQLHLKHYKFSEMAT